MDGYVFVTQTGESYSSTSGDITQGYTINYGAFCFFNDSEKTKLANLDKGANIKIKGTVGDVKEVDGQGPFVTLNSCVIE